MGTYCNECSGSGRKRSASGVRKAFAGLIFYEGNFGEDSQRHGPIFGYDAEDVELALDHLAEWSGLNEDWDECPVCAGTGSANPTAVTWDFWWPGAPVR